jgi:hypothetical protein
VAKEGCRNKHHERGLHGLIKRIGASFTIKTIVLNQRENGLHAYHRHRPKSAVSDRGDERYVDNEDEDGTSNILNAFEQDGFEPES